MKALLLAATSSLALTGFAMAQTAVETDTSGAAATPPAAGSTATDSSAAATGGMGGSGADATGGVAAGGADASGTTSGDAAAGGTSGGMTTGGDAATGTTGAASGAATGTTGMSSDAATGSMGTTDSGSAMDTDTTGTDSATTTTTTVTATSGDAGAAAMTANHPGMLGSWIMNRRIWTTNQPSSTEWAGTTLTERPAEWTDIAKVDDIVVDAQGNITGYVADIGGFLGLGAKQVLLNKDALHFVQIGDDAFFATNFTREELEALPDFDTTTVMR